MARRARGEGSVHRHGDGWRARVTINGRTIERRAPTKDAAIVARDELVERARYGRALTAWTVEDWIEHWVAAIADLTPDTERGYRSSLRVYIAPAFGRVKLADLHPEHLERLYQAMRDGTHRKPRKLKNGRIDTPRPLAGNTIAQVHAILRRALRVAMQRGHVTRNVAELVEPPSRGKPRTETMSVEDARAVLAAATLSPWAARWSLAIMCGVRPAEALGLTWDCLDGDRLTIRQQLTRATDGSGWALRAPKTDAGVREIALPGLVVEQLGEWRRTQLAWMLDDGWREWVPAGGAGPVLPMFSMPDGSPIKPRYDADEWARLLVAAGLPHRRRYVARHTAASLMLHSGTDIAVVAATLGHRDSGFTLRTYVHPLEAEKAAAADRMGRLLAP